MYNVECLIDYNTGFMNKYKHGTSSRSGFVFTFTGCPKKNALSELCGICVRTKFFGYFGYFEQASLQPSF